MWIARDKDNSIRIYDTKPYRCGQIWKCKSKSQFNIHGMNLFDNTLFPKLMWEDEPLEVNIVSADFYKHITEKMNMIEDAM